MSNPNQTEELVSLLTGVQRRLYLYIRSMVPQREDAEEVLQEVNLFIWRHSDEFTPGTDFAAWAYRIAYYHVLTYRKRMARQKVRFCDALVEQLAQKAVDVAERTDIRQEALEECIQKLTPEDRELVRQRYQGGGSAQELAGRIGRSIKAVYYALNRIHLRLLSCIQSSLRTGGIGDLLPPKPRKEGTP